MKTTEVKSVLWTATASALLLASAGQPSSAFAPSPIGTRRPQHQLSSYTIPGPTSRPHTFLNVIADAPIEDHEKQKKGDGESNKENGDEEAAWISKDGGFIPNIKARLSRSKKASPPNTILEVTDIQAYKTEVAEETERMVCVRFYAPFCRSCKAIQPMFRKLPHDFPGVKFVEVPLTKENAYLHKGLGVPSLPFAHLYHPDVGLVEERKINKDLFSTFKKILKTYVEGECAVSYPEDHDDEPAFQ